MKRYLFYVLAKSRRFANTERGERVVVRVLTSMSVLLIVSVSLLIIGSAL